MGVMMKINYLRDFFTNLFVVSLVGCGLSDMGSHAGDMRLAWSEQVRLPGGEQAVTNSVVMGRTGGAWGGPVEWLSSETTLRIPAVMPGRRAPPPWHGTYIPVLLDYDAQQDRWTFLATVLTCPQWYALGRPSAPYLQYVTQDGAPWALVPLDVEYFGQKSNLLTGPRQTDEDRLVTLQEKSERKRRSSERFVKIMPFVKTNC
jgi:hypothetical protein